MREAHEKLGLQNLPASEEDEKKVQERGKEKLT